jgi:hypothetical protein
MLKHVEWMRLAASATALVVLGGVVAGCGHDRMTRDKKVLLIGLDPKVVDYAQLPEKLDEPTLRARLATDERRLRDLGYDARWLLVDRGETAEGVVSAALEEKTFDCILIGAGIRTIPTMFLLFEKLVNVIHAKAPHAKICFNTVPQDTALSVQRCLTWSHK